VAMAWGDDGDVTFAASRGDTRNIWRLSISQPGWHAGDTPRRVTSGAGLEDLPSTAPGRIAFVSFVENADIWSLALDPVRGAATGVLQRLTDNAAMEIQPALSADGRLLVFASNRAGNFDIWKRDLRTGEEVAVSLSPAFESLPKITADGSKVAYNRLVGQKAELYVTSTDGGAQDNAMRVCEDDCFLPWGWLPDNRHLLYWSRTRAQIGVVDVVSREKAIVLEHPRYPLLRPDVSADGRWVAFLADIGVDRAQLFIAPFRGTSPIPEDTWFPGTNGDSRAGIAQWSRDGNALYVVSRRDGYNCLWKQPLERETKRPVGEMNAVYHLHDARRSISNVRFSYVELSLTRDHIVFPMSERIGNVWMVEWQ
jgi:Tol biopolymer transport system component